MSHKTQPSACLILAVLMLPIAAASFFKGYHKGKEVEKSAFDTYRKLYTNQWYEGALEGATLQSKSPELQPSAVAEWAFQRKYYSSSVRDFEVWNEPHIEWK